MQYNKKKCSFLRIQIEVGCSLNKQKCKKNPIDSLFLIVHYYSHERGYWFQNVRSRQDRQRQTQLEVP